MIDSVVRPLTFHELVPNAWLRSKGPEEDAVLCGLYPSALISSDQLENHLAEVTALTGSICPNGIQISALGSLKFELMASRSLAVCYSKARRVFYLQLDKIPVPEGDYLLISAPIAGGTGGEAAAREAVSAARGLIVSLFGHTAADQRTCEFFLKSNGHLAYASAVQENHLSLSRFRFLPSEWTTSLVERFQYLDKDTQQRFRLAVRYLDRAAGEVDPTVRFSNTWIALEIASSGSPDSLIKKITVDGQKSGTLGQLDLARNALFHRGQAPNISQNAERVLYLAALSDVLFRVGIEPQAVAALVAEIESKPDSETVISGAVSELVAVDLSGLGFDEV